MVWYGHLNGIYDFMGIRIFKTKLNNIMVNGSPSTNIVPAVIFFNFRKKCVFAVLVCKYLSKQIYIHICDLIFQLFNKKII